MAFVTTVLPVYNGEAHLEEALISLARQTRKPDRVVVLDNCSTDRTREIVTSFTGIKCEYRLNEQNLGLFGNHNRALTMAAETDYLHIFHADDVLLPEFFARMVAELDKVEGAGIGWCHVQRIDEAGRSLPPLVPIEAGPPATMSMDDFLKARARLWGDIYISGTVLKTNRQPMPCRFREDMKQVADFYFWAEWATHCVGFMKLRESLLKYRAHPLSTTWLNQTDLDVLVHEHWSVIDGVEAMRKTAGFERALRRFKLACFFAAFLHGNMKAVRVRSPATAMGISHAGRRKVGPLVWWLGKTAYYLRELARGASKT